ncbi:MAG: hypothetical protein IPM34_14240 [Saprospiraceae bacterium]|nr:hypothetical protein [Saprospiraceae bacterium]
MRNFAQGFTLPDWFIYSAPDGLWMFSFVMSMLSIWNFKLNNTSGKWMLSAILVGLGFELLQIIYRKLGVFDFNDLFIMLVSAAFTLMFFSNKKTPDIQVETNKYQSKQTEVIKI